VTVVTTEEAAGAVRQVSTVRDVGERVEVTGYSVVEVERALRLLGAVNSEAADARDRLHTQVNIAMLKSQTPLISQASQSHALRRSALRMQLLEEQGYDTHGSLAQKRQTQESSARTWVARERERGNLFTLKLQGTTIIPSVQLTDDGSLHESVTELVRILRGAGMDGWSLWAWLCSPTGLLSGNVPAQVAESNPERAMKAATRMAAELKPTRPTVA